jgi:HSP20 family molecular chaperone IbpA
LCLERIAGTFVRRVPLKWTINYDRVTATLAKGILEIRMPKLEASGNELFIPIIQEREG